MKKWSFHRVRHFFCSILVDLGENLETVRGLAGQSSLAVTQRCVHAKACDLAAAIRLFGG